MFIKVDKVYNYRANIHDISISLPVMDSVIQNYIKMLIKNNTMNEELCFASHVYM